MVKWLSGLFDNTDKELGRLRKSVNESNAEAVKLLEAEREHIASIRGEAFGEMAKADATAELQAIYASEVESVTAATRRLAGEAESLRAVIEEGEQTSRDLSVLLADAKQLATMNSEKVQRPPAERRELEAEIGVLVEELSEQLVLMLEAKPALRDAILQAVPKAKLPPQIPSADEMSKQVEATAAFLGREVAGYFSRTNETMLALRRAVGLQRLAELSHEGFTPPSTTDMDVAAQELVRALVERDLWKHFTRQGLRLPQELKVASGVEDAPQSTASGSKDGGGRRFGASRPSTPDLQPMGKDSLADELYWEEQATGELLAMAASAIGEKPQLAVITDLAEKFAGREERLQARTSIFRARIIEARTAFWQEIQGKIADVVGAEMIAPYAARFEELGKEQDALIAEIEEQDSNWDLPVTVKPDTVADLMQRRDILENQTFTELMNHLRVEDRGAYDRLKALQEGFRKDQRKDEQNMLTELIPEAFAVIWEASRRTTALRPYDVQFIGGIILFEGKIAEMKTGEGKTLVAVAPLYLNALSARGAHLCTVNEYLVKRDSDWMGAIYKMLGLSVGVILSGMAPWERKSEYASDITYGTTSEFGFDYLRDNIANSPDDMVQRPHNFCIVDEVDNILIDEARTPLIISGASEGSADVHIKAAQFAKTLRAETDYTVDEKSRSATLTDEGINRAEQFFRIDNLYHPDNFQLVYGVDNALKAHTLFRRDKDYVLWQEGKVVSASERLNPKLDVEVVIVDEFTGRMMQGRRYSEGLHEAIEAKEGIRVQSESQTFATITIQNYFRLYPKLAGMTGTAATEAEEFFKIYKLEVMPVPTHRPMVRADNPDRIYRTEPAKFAAVVDEIEEMRKEGRPVLVGTVSIEKSEELSRMLEERGVPHSVLNAKQHEREASIVAQAGQRGAVTIATNMAGRGTDITLGFGVNELGGLHIIGTERHESRRIDNQLRGRAGRQGDSGSSRFFVSVEDEIMRRSGVNQNIVNSNLFKNLWDETMPIEHSMISRSVEQAQVKMEGFNFDTRKHLVEYDDVVNTHRDVIYNERRFVIRDGDPRPIIGEMISEKVQEFAAPAGDDARKKRDRDATSGYTEMFDALKETFPDDILRRLLRSILTARVVPVLEEGDTEGFIEEIKLLAQEAYESTQETQVKNVDEKLQEFYHVGDEYYEIAGEGTLDYDKLTRMLSLPPAIVNKMSAEEMDYDAAREFLSEIVRENFAAAQQPLLEKLQSFLEEQTRHANIPQENAPKEQLELLTRALVETIDSNFPLSPVSAARYVEAESGNTKSSMMGGVGSDGVVAEIRDQLELLYAEVEKTLGDVFIETNLQMPLISLVDNRLPRSVYEQIEERLGVEGLEQVENVPLGQLDPEAREVVKDAFVRWQESDLMLRVIDYLWTRHLTTMEQLRHSIGLQAYGQKDPLVQYKVKAYELFDGLKAEIRQLVVLNVLLMGAKAEAARAATRPAPPQSQREAQAPTNGRAQNDSNGNKPRHSQSQARAQARAGGQRTATPAPVGAGVGPGHRAKIGRNDPCFCGSGRKYKQCHGR